MEVNWEQLSHCVVYKHVHTMLCMYSVVVCVHTYCVHVRIIYNRPFSGFHLEISSRGYKQRIYYQSKGGEEVHVHVYIHGMYTLHVG